MSHGALQIYFCFGLNSALRPLRSAMATRIVIATTIETAITTTTPPTTATVLSELELGGSAAVCGELAVDILSPGPTGTVNIINV